MSIEKLTNPEFIFGEILPKNGSMHDQRQFIYCPQWLSLIEVVPMDFFLAAWPKEQPQKTFYRGDEEFLFVITQNNIQMISEMHEMAVLKGELEAMNEDLLLDRAWEYYVNYLNWEDEQIY